MKIFLLEFACFWNYKTPCVFDIIVQLTNWVKEGACNDSQIFMLLVDLNKFSCQHQRGPASR